MVEESTAASTSLASEVERLREIILEFRVGSSGDATSPNRRPEPVRADHKAVPSPARRMVAKVSSAATVALTCSGMAGPSLGNCQLQTWIAGTG